MSAQMAPVDNTGSWQVNLSAALLVSSVSVVRGTILRRHISLFQIHVQARCGRQTHTSALGVGHCEWRVVAVILVCWVESGHPRGVAVDVDGRHGVILVAGAAQEAPMVRSEHKIFSQLLQLL